jgi:hypothetical protein
VTLQGASGEICLYKGIDLPGSIHALLLSPSSRPSAFQASRWGASGFSGEVRVRATSSGDLTAGELALVVVPTVLPSSCCCLEERNLEEVGALPPLLDFKDFHHAARLQSPTNGIQKDDYQPCGGEKQAELRPPSYPQLQGCSSSVLGRRASRVGAPPFTRAGGPLLPPAFGGEGRSPALRRRRTSATRGRPSEAPSAAARLAPRPGWLWCRLRCCLLPLGRGVDVRPPHGQWSRRARVRHIHDFSRATGRTRGPYKTPYATGAAVAFLDGLGLTPWEDGSEDLFTRAEAAVVHRCGGGRCRRC